MPRLLKSGTSDGFWSFRIGVTAACQNGTTANRKTYSDYMASHPTQDYEPFDDYITRNLGKTYSDAMKDKAKAEGESNDTGTAISETGSIQTDNIL